LDITSLDDGTVTVTAHVDDAAGNHTDTAGDDATKDTVVPKLAVTTPIAGDDKINATEAASLDIAGTTDAEDGQTVTVNVSDASSSVGVNATVSGGA